MAVSIGSSVAGGINSAEGARAKGQAGQDMYNYKAAVAQVNKQIAEQNADYAFKVGEVQAQQSGMKTRAAVGSSRVQGGASGLDVNKGSKAAVTQSVQDVGGFEQAIIRSNASKKAYNYKVEATNLDAQGNLDLMAGVNAKRAGEIDATSSILGTISSVSTKWLGFKNAGVFGSPAKGLGGSDISHMEGA